MHAAESFSCSNVDLWFGNDESSSVTGAEFVDSREFIEGIAAELTFGASSANGALFGWANTFQQSFNLSLNENFPDRASLYSRSFSFAGTNISTAISYGHDLILGLGTQPLSTQDAVATVNTGGRDGRKQILVILTDATSIQIGSLSNNTGTAIIAAADAFKSDTTLFEPSLAFVAIDAAAIQSDVLTAAASSADLYQEAPKYPDISVQEIVAVAKTLCPTYNTNVQYRKTLPSGDSTPGEGQTIVFRIEAENLGIRDAPQLQVSDVIPGGLTFVGAALTSSNSYDSDKGVWDVGTLAVGTTASLELTLTVDGGQAGNTIDNIIERFDDIDPSGDDLQESITVLQLPTITKSFAESSIVAGSSTMLSIILGNPNTEAIQINNGGFTDTLPTEIAVAATPAIGGSCTTASVTASGNTITYADGAEIPAGGCTITLAVTASTPGTFTNQIAIGGLMTNAGANAAAASADLTITAQAPTLSKSFLPADIMPGGVARLTLTLANANAVAATLNTALVDNLPAGMTVANTPNISTTCPAAVLALANSDSISYPSGGSIPGGGCSISVDITSATLGAVVNTIPAAALVTSLGNNAEPASATLLVAESTDLITVKTSSATVASVGSNVNFQVTVTNNGPRPATNISLIDQMPMGISLLNGIPDQGSFDAESGLWSIGTLAVNATAQINLTGVVDTGQGGNSITNITSAADSADFSDPSTAGDILQASISILALPTISKSFTSTSIALGEITQLSLSIGNSNTQQINLTADLVDVLPAGLTVADTPNIGGSCPGLTRAVAASQTVTYIDGAAIPVNGCTIVVDIIATQVGVKTNTLVAGIVDTTAGANDTAVSAQLIVTAVAPTVAKGFLPAEVAPGEVSRLSLEIGNSNALAAILLSDLVDEFPAGMQIAPLPNSSGSCDQTAVVATAGANQLIYQAAASIPVGGCTIAVDIVRQTLGLSTNTVAVGALRTTAGDSIVAASAELLVMAQSADLVTLKTLSTGDNNAQIDDQIDFLLSVTNSGPAPADNITLVDVLPPGLTFISSLPGQGSYVAQTGLWSIGSLSNGDSASLIISARVNTDQAGNTLTNITTAASTPDLVDPDDGSDDLTESIVVAVTMPQLGAAMQAEVVGDVGTQGELSIRYTVVVKNTGDQKLQNLQLIDDLSLPEQLSGAFDGIISPPVVTLVNNSGDSVAPTSNGAAYDGTNGLLVGDDGLLAVGDSYQLVFVVNVNPRAFNAPDRLLALATATGIDPAGVVVTDTTDAGVDPGLNPGGLGAATGIDSADVALSKNVSLLLDADGSSTLTPGDQVRFTLVINNSGPSQARGLEVGDRLSARYAYISDDGGGVYDPDSGIWNIGLLAVNASQTLNIDALVRSNGDITNNAEVTRAIVSDPDSAPNNAAEGRMEDDEAASPPNPNIGLASQFGTPEPLRDGDFNIPVVLLIKNTSIVDLDRIDVQSDLGAVFGADNVRLISLPVATGDLVVNPNFDAVTDTGLLDIQQSILRDNSDVTISFVISVTPAANQIEYLHNAHVSAFSNDSDNPGVVIFVEDISTAGSEPDTNGNNNAEEQLPNIIRLELAAAVEVTLAASPAVPAVAGSSQFDTVLTIDLSNQGNLPLSDVGLDNDLALLFPGGFELLGSPVSTSGSLIIDPDFNGMDKINLLDSDPSDGITSTLGVGQQGRLLVGVRFNPGAAQSFEHEVVLSAVDEQGNSLAASSTDGIETEIPRPATTISVVPIASIGLAQSASPARRVIDANTVAEDLVYTTQFNLTVENLGNTGLEDVQVQSLLSAALPQGTIIVVSQLSITGALDQVNSGFDGGPDSALLVAGQSLAVGATAIISFEAKLDFPDNTIVEEFAVVANSRAVSSGEAQVQGVLVDAVVVEDIADDGTVPDTNGNGSASDGNENDPTPIVISTQPVIGLLQQIVAQNGAVVTLRDQGDLLLPLDQRTLTYQYTISLDVVNLGSADLNEIELVDFITSTFPSLTEQGKVDVSAPRIISGSLVANANFDGISDPRLLDSGNSSLAIRERGTVEFDVRVQIDFADAAGIAELQQQSFRNSAVVNGTAVLSGTKISDISNDLSQLALLVDIGSVINAVDPDGDFDPNELGENEPTPIVFPAAIQGLVFQDIDGDGSRTEDEPVLAGWSVIIRDAVGAEVATAIVDAAGYYAVPIVPAGLYEASFITPSGVIAGSIKGLAISTMVLDLDFVVDPGGIVYDSRSRLPINDVQLFVVNVASNERLNVACLAEGQQGQVTGTTLGLTAGEYKFDINPGADVTCPAVSTVYGIEIQVNDEPFSAPSNEIPASEDVLVATSCVNDADPLTARCEVSASQFAPQVGEPTLYFLQFELAENAPDIINNHIPLDSNSAPANILLSKIAHKKTVSVGEMVPYTITAENLSNEFVSAIILRDQIPAGFGYVQDSARLIRAGLDGLLDTQDDIVTLLAVTEENPLEFAALDFFINEQLAVSYLLRVGAGIRPGTAINRVLPLQNDKFVGSVASASIEVVADPFFDRTTIVGKVFNDQNGNGIQDAARDNVLAERGIAGVRLVTVGGENITTDQNGRYHMAGVDAGENDRGRQFIIKVDPASLPAGSTFTTENPRVMRITSALMSRIDFGVRSEKPGQADKSVVDHKSPGLISQANNPNSNQAISRQRAIVSLKGNIFVQQAAVLINPELELNANGIYQLSRLSELIIKNEYQQYVVRLPAIAHRNDAIDDARRVLVIRQYLLRHLSQAQLQKVEIITGHTDKLGSRYYFQPDDKSKLTEMRVGQLVQRRIGRSRAAG